MRYADGNKAEPGDIVQIDGRYRGRVVACIEAGRSLPGYEWCEYLKEGFMIDTDFGGLVHYPNLTCEEIVLAEPRPES